MSDRKGTAASAGIGMGTALAMTMSWGLHHSIGLAIVHGVLNWIYVAIWVLS